MRTVIGLTEYVTVFGKEEKKVKARVDTGATKSSMDIFLARELHLGPVLTRRKVKSAHGIKVRPVIQCDIMFAGRRMKALFTVTDRNHMKYRMLIGQDVMKKANVIIDPSIE